MLVSVGWKEEWGGEGGATHEKGNSQRAKAVVLRRVVWQPVRDGPHEASEECGACNEVQVHAPSLLKVAVHVARHHRAGERSKDKRQLRHEQRKRLHQLRRRREGRQMQMQAVHGWGGC